MARRDATGPVTLSVLDRLIDRDPKTRSEIPFHACAIVARVEVGPEARSGMAAQYQKDDRSGS